MATTQHAAERGRILDFVFRWAVVAKGVYGIGEVLVGTFLSIVSPVALQSWATILTQQRLDGDGDDFIWTSIVHFVDGLTSSAVTFAAIYLIVHGLVKIVLLAAVLTKKYHVYPWAIGILIAFIGYQTYELVVAFSIGLLALTLFDAVIVILTWREYDHRPRAGVDPDAAEDAPAGPRAGAGTGAVSERDRIERERVEREMRQLEALP